jgi:hypothetical protein
MSCAVKPVLTLLLIAALTLPVTVQDYGWAMRAKPQSPGDDAGFYPIV